MSIDPITGLDPALTIDYVDNWQQRLRDRIYAQFKGLPIITGVSDIIAKQTQDLENAIQSCLTALSIDDSSGPQLQVIAKLVGQPYAGENDATFRLYLKARIRANRSDGSPPALYAVFNAMFDNAATGQAQIVPFPPAPAALDFRVTGFPITPPQASVLLELLSASVMGGVRIVVEWMPDQPSALLQTVDAQFNYPGFATNGTVGLGLGDAANPTATAGELAGALSS